MFNIAILLSLLVFEQMMYLLSLLIHFSLSQFLSDIRSHFLGIVYPTFSLLVSACLWRKDGILGRDEFHFMTPSNNHVLIRQLRTLVFKVNFEMCVLWVCVLLFLVVCVFSFNSCFHSYSIIFFLYPLGYTYSSLQSKILFPVFSVGIVWCI